MQHACATSIVVAYTVCSSEINFIFSPHQNCFRFTFLTVRLPTIIKHNTTLHTQYIDIL